MAARVVVVLGALLFAAACQLPGSSSSCNAQIDWVNFIQVGSTQYVAGPQSPTVLQESELGPVYAHVKFKVSGNVCDPNYRLKDGDSAFLDPGTPILSGDRRTLQPAVGGAVQRQDRRVRSHAARLLSHGMPWLGVEREAEPHD